MTAAETRQDIADLLVRYATGIDSREWELFRTCFTDDCELDYGPIGVWNGVEAVTGYMRDAHAEAGHTLHRISNIASTVDGGRARVRSYVDALIMATDGESGMNAIGFYDDDLTRTETGWRIERRRFTMVRLGVLGG